MKDEKKDEIIYAILENEDTISLSLSFEGSESGELTNHRTPAIAVVQSEDNEHYWIRSSITIATSTNGSNALTKEIIIGTTRYIKQSKKKKKTNYYYQDSPIRHTSLFWVIFNFFVL